MFPKKTSPTSDEFGRYEQFSLPSTRSTAVVYLYWDFAKTTVPSVARDGSKILHSWPTLILRSQYQMGPEHGVTAQF
jgi:hypothetical protein